MAEGFDSIKNEANTENKERPFLTDEEAAQVSGGYWYDCPGCNNYGRAKDCNDAKKIHACPCGHVY